MEANQNKIIEIYTDGACIGNPGNGGWAALLLYKENKKQISGFEKETTNNRMELKAVIEALKTIKDQNFEIKIYTDSKYVIDGITKWVKSWKNNSWKTATNKPVKNNDLWKILDDEVAKFSIIWYWVKGHSGNQYNEFVDKLARKSALLK
jgi:ribonuclease HI